MQRTCSTCMWWKRDVRTEYEKRHEDQRFGYCNNEKKFIYGDNKTIYLDTDDGEVKVRLEPDDGAVAFHLLRLRGSGRQKDGGNQTRCGSQPKESNADCHDEFLDICVLRSRNGITSRFSYQP